MTNWLVQVFTTKKMDKIETPEGEDKKAQSLNMKIFELLEAILHIFRPESYAFLSSC
jgi:hypothetical protein